MATPPISSPNSLSSHPLFFPTPSLPFQFHTQFPSQAKTSHNRRSRFLSLCTSYEVGGGYPESDFLERERTSHAHTQDQFNEKMDNSQYEALLKGGEQVTSVLQEMITLLEDMNMDAASEEVAVQLAAQGVIGKRVDQMESGFMMALDYMIQTAENDQDDQRKSLLEVVKETVLSHLTKKCPPHVQVIGLLCRTPKKDSRHELLRRVAAGGGEFKGENGTKFTFLVPIYLK